MNLISDGDWLEVRAALKDVKDTFLIMPVTYAQRRARKLTMFHENRKNDLELITYRLTCLKIEEANSDKALVMQSQKGFADISEGYLLFDYQVLKAYIPNFIDADGRCVIIPNQDTMVCQGEELTIIGVNLVGPTQTDFQLVKVHFKKNLINDNPLPLPNSPIPVVDIASWTLHGFAPNLINDTSVITMPVAVS